MKRLGTVENLSYDGSLLVRAESAPPTGARVVDKRERAIGRIVKVFGPVGAPFVAVRTEGKVPLSLLGSDVYVREERDAATKGRRGRRGH